MMNNIFIIQANPNFRKNNQDKAGVISLRKAFSADSIAGIKIHENR
jgi:hypothetical protein